MVGKKKRVKAMKGKRVKAMGGKNVGMGKRVKARGGSNSVKKVGMGKRVKQRSGGATKRVNLRGGGGPAELGVTRLLALLAGRKMTPAQIKKMKGMMGPEDNITKPLPRDFKPEYETGPYTPPKKPKKNTKVIEAAKKFAKKK